MGRGVGCMARTIAEGSIWASQEGKDTAARLGEPNDLAQQATGFADGVGAERQGEPLEDDAGIVCRERGDGCIGKVEEFADKGGSRLWIVEGLWANEETAWRRWEVVARTCS